MTAGVVTEFCSLAATTLADRGLRSPLRSVMQHQELIGRQREFSVSLPFVVGKFNLKGTIQEFHDGANLPAQETMRGQI